MIPLYTTSKPLRKIGEIDEEAKILHKWFKGSKHIFRADKSLGLDYYAWQDTLLPSNYEIRALDMETKICYYTDAKTYKKKGEVRQFNKDLQIFLPLKYWKSKKL